MRILHPRFRTLNEYHDGNLPEERRRRVAAHLVDCARCRNTIAFFRMIDKAARELPPHDPKPEVLQQILARRNQGDLIVLPISDITIPPPRQRPLAGFAAAAVIIMVALSAVATFLGVPELTADRSELRFIPEAPRAGDVVRVEYRPGSLLRGEERLILRTRFRTGDDPTHWDYSVPHIPVTELVLDRQGVYTGEFKLPEGVVYATFAVEDRAAQRVDHNAFRLWELLVYEADGTPNFDALRVRAEDLSSRGRGGSFQAARAIIANYPDRPSAWRAWASVLFSLADGSIKDSLLNETHQRFRQLETKYLHEATLSTQEIVAMSELARLVDDREGYERWRRRIIESDPDYREVSYWPAYDAFNDNNDDPARALDELTAMWDSALPGPARQTIAMGAYNMAFRLGDHERLLTWVDRYLEYHPWDLANVATRLAWTPAFEEAGFAIMRREIAAASASDDQRRRLTTSRPEYQTLIRQDVFWLRAELGRALVNAGRLEEGLAELAAATSLDWHPGVFEFTADALMAAGDTVAAIEALARVAVDPVTSMSQADSLRRFALAHVRPDVWESWTRSARVELQRMMLQDAVLKPLPTGLVLKDWSGTEHRFNELAGGNTTLVAFWSREIGSSRVELPTLQRLADELAANGVQVITVTWDPSTPDLAHFLEEQGFSLPVYFDTDQQVSTAFGVAWAPEYFLLDEAGWIRFELSRKHAYIRPNWNHAVDRLVRQAVAIEPAVFLAQATDIGGAPEIGSGR